MTPIESALHEAILRSDAGFTFVDLTSVHTRVQWDGYRFGIYANEPWPEYSPKHGRGPTVWLYSQVTFRSYVLDFVVERMQHGIIAVECDGHDAHERTKQQAAYDRSRDRELLVEGIPTMRFTGSEIFHSAERCVADLVSMLRSMPFRWVG